MMSTVLSVAFPFAAVRPDTAGGAEQVLRMLDREIIRAGHGSIVVAAEGSLVEGELAAIGSAEGSIDVQMMARIYGRCKSAINYVLRTRKIDLIHFHGLDFHRYLPDSDVPALVTLHLPTDLYSWNTVRHRRRLYFNCVSMSQQLNCPPVPGLVPFIANGVELHRHYVRPKKSNFALALGRICPEKGFHLAMDAAQAADIGLVLAGEIFGYPEHENYYRNEILSRLKSFRHCFVGRIGGLKKKLYLSRALCLLVPSLIQETSSLVAMEAMSCGTPVIAFRSGALKEIVEDGKTGFLVDTVDEMSEAIACLGKIDPDICRDRALKNFSSKKTAERYIDLYKRIISRDVVQ